MYLPAQWHKHKNFLVKTIFTLMRVENTLFFLSYANITNIILTSCFVGMSI